MSRSSSAPRFRTDLYQGTAEYYDRFRPSYPDELFADLRARVPVTGRGRLLDLACGTGQVTFPLAPHFAAAVGVDQEPETVAFATAKAARLKAPNITWLVGTAEAPAVDGPFELITVGTAFHRLDRAATARRMRELVADDGAVALLWAAVPSEGIEPWQQQLRHLIADWTERVGIADRLPPEWEASIAARSHRAVLEDAAFDYVGRFEFTRAESWTAESLLGFLHSTSILSKVALGDAAHEFAADLAARLDAVSSDGGFRYDATYCYELCRPRPVAAQSMQVETNGRA